VERPTTLEQLQAQPGMTAVFAAHELRVSCDECGAQNLDATAGFYVLQARSIFPDRNRRNLLLTWAICELCAQGVLHGEGE
jgi:hypothetical protein